LWVEVDRVLNNTCIGTPTRDGGDSYPAKNEIAVGGDKPVLWKPGRREGLPCGYASLESRVAFVDAGLVDAQYRIGVTIGHRFNMHGT
jgi:hypothetical protein